jgi:uncharacterized phage protein gp47/JayE
MGVLAACVRDCVCEDATAGDEFLTRAASPMTVARRATAAAQQRSR